MKTLLTAIALFFSLSLCMAQTGLVSGNLNITTFPSNVGGGRFQVAGSFSDPKGQWFTSDVDTGMIMWKGNNLYLIDSILTVSGPNITFRVQDIYSTGFIATGTAQVLELTENLGLPAVSTTGDSNAALATPPDHAALLNYLVEKIDSIVGNLPSGADGNGIYSGSGTLLPGDTTIVTALSGSAIKIGNTIQSPSSITTINDVNHWGTYNGWDRASYSYGGFSGYYWFRGNGTAASKTALNVDDVMHEWSFLGQKSPTEENYALIMKPTVDEITGGNNWGRLDFQGADFQTWLSLRRTGIRAGTAANYTTFPASRPAQNSFWRYNSNGTGEYISVNSLTDGNGIYSGSGTLPADVNVNFQANRQLKFSNTGIGANEFIQFRDSTIFGQSEIAFYRNGTKTGKMFWDDQTYKRVVLTSEGGATGTSLAVGQGSFSLGNFNLGGLFLGFDSTLVFASPKPYILTSNAFAPTASTRIPLARPVSSNAFWQHNTDGTAQYVTPGGMSVTNPAGGSNTLQATLDSISNTWLKPKLESADVTINSADNTLILNKASMTTDPAIHVVHPVPTIGVTRRLFSAGQTSSGYAFEIAQHSDNSYKISTSQALLTLESSSLGDPTQAQLGNGEMYIVNSSGPSSIKLNSTSNTVSIAAPPTLVHNWTLTLPTNRGNAGQFLQNLDGSGATTWANPVVPNVGGISALRNNALTYSVNPLGSGSSISLPVTVGTKTGITKVTYDSGHGIEVSFGGTATCNVTAFVTLQSATAGLYTLRLYRNNNLVYPDGGGGTIYASVNLTANTPETINISHLVDIDSGDIMSIKVDGATATATINSAGLTVLKTQ